MRYLEPSYCLYTMDLSNTVDASVCLVLSFTRCSTPFELCHVSHCFQTLVVIEALSAEAQKTLPSTDTHATEHVL